MQLIKKLIYKNLTSFIEFLLIFVVIIILFLIDPFNNKAFLLLLFIFFLSAVFSQLYLINYKNYIKSIAWFLIAISQIRVILLYIFTYRIGVGHLIEDTTSILTELRMGNSVTYCYMCLSFGIIILFFNKIFNEKLDF